MNLLTELCHVALALNVRNLTIHVLMLGYNFSQEAENLGLDTHVFELQLALLSISCIKVVSPPLPSPPPSIYISTLTFKSPSLASSALPVLSIFKFPLPLSLTHQSWVFSQQKLKLFLAFSPSHFLTLSCLSPSTSLSLISSPCCILFPLPPTYFHILLLSPLHHSLPVTYNTQLCTGFSRPPEVHSLQRYSW